MIYDICVRHEDHRDEHVLPQFADEIENDVGRDTAFKCLKVGTLDDRPLRSWIRERDAELDEICAVCHCRAHDFTCRLKVRKTAGDERNKCFAVIECSIYVAHMWYPPKLNILTVYYLLTTVRYCSRCFTTAQYCLLLLTGCFSLSKALVDCLFLSAYPRNTRHIHIRG